MANRATVLVVDDEALSLDTVRRILEDEFEVRTALSAAAAEEILAQDWIQVILCDQRMPGITGVEFLARVRQTWPDVVRIIVSGYTDAEDIIRGINEAGIYQFITKPWHPDQLLLSVRNAARLYQLQRENELLSLEAKVTAETLEQTLEPQRAQLKSRFRLDNIVRAEDSPLNKVCEQVLQVAPYDVSVMLTGESGTGKELFARALHYNSLRADKPFVVENCGALPDELLESELFGHKRGAFTGAVGDRIGLFEQASGGTIFLDEIGDVSPAFQVKLLRVLQEGEIRPLGTNTRRKVDVRVIAATNHNLEEDVRRGRFREDLYYRLTTFQIHLPPLRDRPGDIPLLAQSILDEAMRNFGKRVDGFSEETMMCLRRYDWPGNVRQLRNEILRMLVLAAERRLTPDLLSPRVRDALGEMVADAESVLGTIDIEDQSGSLKERVESLEARLLRDALIRHRGNKSRAAEELGLSRVGLRSKLERYGLEGGKSAY